MALPGRETGVRQQVHLPVHRVLRYTGSLYARHFSGPAEAEVSLRRRNHPEIVLARALQAPLVRYGGNFTSGYHWRDGVGPLDQRVSRLNQAWGIPEYNHFGTDEFLRFCQLIGAEPQITLNLGSGTPEEAAEWVRYVNARWGDRSGGLLWELGNELWGTFQIGYPTLERVAALNEARDRLTLFVVNRDLHRDLPARVTLAGFAPAARARVQTLAGTSIHQPNDELRPEAVRPVESILEVRAPEFNYIFPRASVSVIELPGR
jgi:alpha-L-arabinofuranosidase